MKDVEQKKYASRKQWEYDDDTAVLFYDGNKIAKVQAESLRRSWREENQYFKNDMYGFLDDVADCNVVLDKEDEKENWKHIWNKLAWNNNENCYTYKKWAVVILDL